MGFFSRLLIPRKARRLAHPGRAVKRKITPRPLKRISHAVHPFSNATYSVQRSLNTKHQRRSHKPVYMHGSCPIRHRTPQAAARCRNR